MFRRSLFIILGFVLCLGLVGCDIRDPDGNGPDDKDPVPKVTIKMLEKNGNIQIEDDTYLVHFEATLSDLTGEVVWYVNQMELGRGSTFSYRPSFAADYSIIACVGDVVSNRLSIKVTSKSFQLRILGGDQGTITQYYGTVEPLSFTAKVDGAYLIGVDYTAEDIKWYVNDVQVATGLTFSYTPTDEIDYRATVQAYYKDGSKYKSNFYTVVVKLADLVVDCQGNLSQDDQDFQSVKFVARALNNVSINNLTWYVNDVLLGTGSEITYTPGAMGRYKVVAKLNLAERVVETTPEYIIVGKNVKTQAELLEAIEDTSVTAIYIANDITMTIVSNDAHLNIRRELSLCGYAKLQSAVGASHFINVMADNVYIRDLTVSRSGKYNIQFYNCVGGYIDDCLLDDSGNAGLHLNRSQVTVDDLEVVKCNYAGIELSHPDFGKATGVAVNRPVVLNVVGDILIEEGTFLPIYSSYSQASCIVNSFDFNEFVVSIEIGSEQLIIRRLCNDGCNLGWVVSPPSKTIYNEDEFLDLFNIALKVNLCDEEPMIFDESYIRLLLESSIGNELTENSAIRLEIYDINNNYLRTYYLVDYDGVNYYYSDINGNIIDPVLLYGDARVKLYITDFYIGQFGIVVN